MNTILIIWWTLKQFQITATVHSVKHGRVESRMGFSGTRSFFSGNFGWALVRNRHKIYYFKLRDQNLWEIWNCKINLGGKIHSLRDLKKIIQYCSLNFRQFYNCLYHTVFLSASHCLLREFIDDYMPTLVCRILHFTQQWNYYFQL